MIVQLPAEGGALLDWSLLPPLDQGSGGQPAQARQPPLQPAPQPPRFNRVAYAAAHIVAKPRTQGDPSDPENVDWDATLAFRHHLWRHGFGIAEAMDTAQRETLGWEASARLLEQTLAAAAQAPGRLVMGGAGTDHLTTDNPTLAQIVDAYVMQAEFIHERGGRAILFPTEHLPRKFGEPRHYVEAYRAIASQVSRPVFVHWLGEMFAPRLRGYFPGDSFWEIMEDNPKLLGVKISLLDQAHEEAVRRRLAPAGQVVLTGDDFNYPALIEGEPQPVDGAALEWEGASYQAGDYSHALLGIFDGIATVASQALSALTAGDTETYRRLLAPTVPLSRHIFGEPTRFYKAGLVLLAYLNGHQEHFHLLGDLERERDIVHYATLFRLANQAGVLDDPPQAYERFKPILSAAGVTSLAAGVTSPSAGK